MNLPFANNKRNRQSPLSARDVNVELLRIIACLLVIVIHVKPQNFRDGQLIDTALLLQTLSAPAVGIFFLISGFFIPKSDVLKSWKRFLTGVFLPAVLLVLVTGMLRGWISSEQGLFESIAVAFQNGGFLDQILHLGKGILAFDVNLFGVYTEHLWFVFSYAVIMLWLPLIHIAAKADAKKALLFFALLSAYRLFVIDVNTVYPIPVSLYLPVLAPNEVIFFILGFLLYQKREQLRTHPRIFFSAILLLFAVYGLMFFLQRFYYLNALSQDASAAELETRAYYLNWLSGLSIPAALSLSAAVFCLPLERLGKPFAFICNTLGSYTYPVFLIHYALNLKLRSAGFEQTIKQLLSADTGFGAVLYTFVYTILLFCLSLIVSMLLRTGFRFIQRLLQH